MGHLVGCIRTHETFPWRGVRRLRALSSPGTYSERSDRNEKHDHRRQKFYTRSHAINRSTNIEASRIYRVGESLSSKTSGPAERYARIVHFREFCGSKVIPL